MSKRVKLDKDTLNAVMSVEMSGGELQQFKELATKKDETKTQLSVAKEQQTSGAKGFRIIGVMRNVLSGKNEIVAYVLFNDAKQEHTQYSVEQVKAILGMYKFVNAELVDDQIKITDGSEDAMLQFDAYRNPIGNPTIYVLSRSTDTITANGQQRQQEVITFIDNRLTVQKLPASTIIDAKLAGKLIIANMKVVSNPNNRSSILEAKNLDTIPTYEKVIKPEKVATNEAETFRKTQLKMKNHASFVQRLVNVIDNCVLMQYGATPSRYCTALKMGGTSDLHRGFGYVGVKGLTAIMEKEVIPVLRQKYPSIDFTDALNEVHTNYYKDGSPVHLNVRFFIDKKIQPDLNDPTRCLFYRYLYAFRQVIGLYKTVNVYDILKEYNKSDRCSGVPYIVDCQYYVQQTVAAMFRGPIRPYRVASWQDTSYLFSRCSLKGNNITNIICGGITSISRNHTVLWPLPFKDVDKAMKTLETFPDFAAPYEKLLLHICSEAALIPGTTGAELKYRINRVKCMTAVLLSVYHIQACRSKDRYDTTVLALNLINECAECTVFPIGDACRYQGAYDRQMGYAEKYNDVEYIKSLFLDYATGAGLYIPYYNPLNKTASSEYMHWHIIFSGLQRQYVVKTFAERQFRIRPIEKRHKYGMLYIIDKAFRQGPHTNIEYDISPNSKYYTRIQNHLKERNYQGLQVWTPLTATLSRAAIAQYLGRPYRQKIAHYDSNTTRLVLYMNTYSPKNRNKTHELY